MPSALAKRMSSPLGLACAKSKLVAVQDDGHRKAGHVAHDAGSRRRRVELDGPRLRPGRGRRADARVDRRHGVGPARSTARSPGGGSSGATAAAAASAAGISAAAARGPSLASRPGARSTAARAAGGGRAAGAGGIHRVAPRQMSRTRARRPRGGEPGRSVGQDKSFSSGADDRSKEGLLEGPMCRFSAGRSPAPGVAHILAYVLAYMPEQGGGGGGAWPSQPNTSSDVASGLAFRSSQAFP